MGRVGQGCRSATQFSCCNYSDAEYANCTPHKSPPATAVSFFPYETIN